MGAVLAAPIGCLASCGGSCLGMCCANLAQGGSLEDTKASKHMFFGLQAFGIVLVLMMRSVGESWFHWLPTGISECPRGDSECWQHQMTFRVSMAVFIEFVLLFFLSCAGMQKMALKGYFVGKFMLIPVLLGVFLFMPNSFFDSVASLSIISSIFFMLAQMVLLLDFGHCWNDAWVEASLQDQRRDLSSNGYRWLIGIIVASLVFIVFGITTSIINGQQFITQKSEATIWITFSIGAVLVLLSTTSVIPHGSSLPSAIVFAYMCYVAWGACLEIPIGGDDGEVLVDPLPYQVFGCIFLFLALGSFVRDPSVLTFGIIDEEDEESGGAAQALNNVAEDGGGLENASEPAYKSTIIFFLIHALASLYVIPLLEHDRSFTGFWAMAATTWMMLALFAWSLIAPQVLDRDFGYA